MSSLFRRESDKVPLLLAAIRDGDQTRVAQLARRPHQAWDDQGQQPLHLAVSLKNLEAVRVLVAVGANRMAQNNVGDTPLHLACRAQGMEEFLRALGSSAISAVNHRGQTPLHLACRNSIGPVRILLEMGAKVDATDAKGRCPIHDAAGAAMVESVRLLVEHGADPAAMGDFGVTPLYDAICSSVCDDEPVKEVIRYLLSLGCQPSPEYAGARRLRMAQKVIKPRKIIDGSPLEQLQAEFAEAFPKAYLKLLEERASYGLYSPEEALRETYRCREQNDLSESLLPLGDTGLGDTWFLDVTTGEVSLWLHEESRRYTVAPTLKRFRTLLANRDPSLWG